MFETPVVLEQLTIGLQASSSDAQYQSGLRLCPDVDVFPSVSRARAQVGKEPHICTCHRGDLTIGCA